MASELEREVDRNFEAFAHVRATLLPEHEREWALLRHGEIADFFADEARALRAGRDRFADGIYSIQQVTDRPIDLGFFSHAVDTRLA